MLNSPKLTKRLCENLDRDFHCKEIFDCSVACPLWIQGVVEYNLPLNATVKDVDNCYKRAIRMSIKHEKAEKILEDIFGVDIEIIREQLLLENT